MELFVNGRLCLAGEHSDWASEYKKQNKKIIPGKSLVFGIDQGIYADVKKSNNLTINYNNEKFTINNDLDELLAYAKEHQFYSYFAAASYLMIKNYQVKGVNINIKKADLPIKKGLASSAAICILVIRSFNKLYNLYLSIQEEMNLAYEAEKIMGIKCGKMDQLCAYGKKFISIDYEDNSIEEIAVKKNMYFVFADLKGKKNTKLILESLNKIYPKAKNKQQEKGHKTLGIKNRKIVNKMIKAIRKCNLKKVGKLMTKSQKNFDNNLAYLCPSELTSPKLHRLLKDSELKKYSYGMKGVGSQGDGSIQILAKDEQCQKKIYNILKKKVVDPYMVTVQANKINKVIIALCGKGTRLYPYTKFVTKEFCPVLHNGKLKPQINVLLEYIYDSGIRQITIAVANKKQKKQYKDYFYKNKNDDEQSIKLRNIYKCLKFIIIKNSKGFGDTVLRLEKASKGEPVILFLGDTLYRKKDNNCIDLIKKYYEKYQKPIITVAPKEDEEIPSCGIVKGKVIEDEVMKITRIVEKPKIDYCHRYLQTNDKSYGIYGNYLITKEIFEKLKELKELKENKKDDKELQLTDALINVLKETDMYAVMLENNSLDFGNVNDYAKNFTKLNED